MFFFYIFQQFITKANTLQTRVTKKGTYDINGRMRGFSQNRTVE